MNKWDGVLADDSYRVDGSAHGVVLTIYCAGGPVVMNMSLPRAAHFVERMAQAVRLAVEEADR